MEQRRTGIIIVAGGNGTRIGGSIPKQFRLLGGEPVLGRVINLFARTVAGAKIVVVLPKQHTGFWHDLAARFDIASHTVVEGGEERFHSVSSGLNAMPEDIELIAVHDAVRPLCPEELIRRAMEHGAEYGAAIPVTEPADSFRQISSDGGSLIMDRHMLRAVQTPQVFDAAILRNAYKTPYDKSFTDDASVVEKSGVKVKLFEGERCNIKITSPEDFAVAEALTEYFTRDEDGDSNI